MPTQPTLATKFSSTEALTNQDASAPSGLWGLLQALSFAWKSSLTPSSSADRQALALGTHCFRNPLRALEKKHYFIYVFTP